MKRRLSERRGRAARGAVEMHLELAQRYLREGEAVVDEDPAQASEKVYESAEEAIKSMAHSLGLAEVIDRVAKRGRWTVAELERVARRAKVTAYWDSANYLHVWGFHEAKLDSEAVRVRLPDARKLVERALELAFRREL